MTEYGVQSPAGNIAWLKTQVAAEIMAGVPGWQMVSRNGSEAN